LIGGPSFGGIALLRSRRGDDGTAFSEIADHLEDFLLRYPAHQAAVEALATFLACVEDDPHRHDGRRPGSSLSHSELSRPESALSERTGPPLPESRRAS